MAVDQDGDIYIVETKLYKNSDKRTVVAQALDYGAALWKHFNDFDEFINILSTETKKNFNLEFKDKFKSFFNLGDEQVEFAFGNLKENLNIGNLKFVILMDSLDERLKDLILYVNQNSQFDIYAVQLEYYKFEGYEIMIPKIFGVEVKKNIKSTVKNERRIWNEEDFIKQVKENLGSNSEKLIELYKFLKNSADSIKWGTGNINGSFAPFFNKLSKNVSPFSFYSNGSVYLKFNWPEKYLSEEEVKMYYKNFVELLHKNTDIKIPDDYTGKEQKISKEEYLQNSENLIKTIKMFVESI